jgi:hypothetical protein
MYNDLTVTLVELCELDSHSWPNFSGILLKFIQIG